MLILNAWKNPFYLFVSDSPSQRSSMSASSKRSTPRYQHRNGSECFHPNKCNFLEECERPTKALRRASTRPWWLRIAQKPSVSNVSVKFSVKSFGEWLRTCSYLSYESNRSAICAPKLVVTFWVIARFDRFELVRVVFFWTNLFNKFTSAKNH